MAIGYLRVSTTSQAEGHYSLDAQRDICRRIHSVLFSQYKYEEVMDIGSARTDRRSGYRQIRGMIPHGTIKAIIVVNLDRLCRSVSDFCKLLEVLIRYDVSIYSQDQRIDTSSAMGRFFANTLINVAEFESSLIGERIKRGHDRKYFEGKKGPGLRPFGWIEDDNGFLVREEEEQRIIDLIEARRRKGVSWRECAEILNEMTMKPVKSDTWTPESLRGVMRSAMRRREMDAERGAQKNRKEQ